MIYITYVFMIDTPYDIRTYFIYTIKYMIDLYIHIYVTFTILTLWQGKVWLYR